MSFFRLVDGFLHAEPTAIAALLVTSCPLRSVAVPRIDVGAASSSRNATGARAARPRWSFFDNPRLRTAGDDDDLMLHEIMFAFPSSFVFSPSLTISSAPLLKRFLDMVDASEAPWSLQRLELLPRVFEGSAAMLERRLSESIRSRWRAIVPWLQELRIPKFFLPDLVSLSRLGCLTLDCNTVVSARRPAGGSGGDTEAALVPILKLRMLDTLILNNCSDSLPAQLGNSLPRLAVLELNDCQYSDMAEALAGNTRLRRLHASETFAAPMSISFLAEPSHELLANSLRQLSIVQTLDPWFGDHDEVDEEDQSDTMLSNARVLIACSELTSLSLKTIHMPNFGKVAESMALLECLELDFLSGPALRGLETAVAMMTRLRSFSVTQQWNHSTGAGPLVAAMSVEVLAALSALPVLERVSLFNVRAFLSTRQDDDEDPSRWTRFFRSGFPQLQSLEFSGCEIGGGSANCFFSDLSLLPRLQFLKMDKLSSVPCHVGRATVAAATAEAAAAQKIEQAVVLFPRLEAVDVSSAPAELDFSTLLSTRVPRLAHAALSSISFSVDSNGNSSISGDPQGALFHTQKTTNLQFPSIPATVGVLRLERIESSCFPPLTPMLNGSHRHLVALSIVEAPNMTPSAAELAALGESCPELERIDFSLSGVASVKELVARLQEISLRHCKRMTVDGLRGVESLPMLRRLNIMGCSGVGDLSFLAAAASLAAPCPALEMLVASWTGATTMESVAGIERLPKLRCVALAVKGEEKKKIKAVWREAGRLHVLES